MNALTGHPQTGDIIAGKYQVEDVLGKGGMGVVVAARHMVLRQRVAVKFLLPEALGVPEAAERFLREARAAVAIQSEHVARVLDVGTLDNGAPFLVMEFLAGIDLARLIKQRGRLVVPEAVDLLLQAGEAIAEAHARGIVHRDLKPANLFLTSRADGSPLVKVLDFGLSKVAAQEGDVPGASLTATGFVMGSAHYMSPEQVRSLKNVDWRTDIWALGVILYELLTGRRPFDGPSLTSICASIVVDPPRSPRALCAEIPEAIEAALMACLEKDVARRTHSVAELAQAIAPFAPPTSRQSVERIVRLLFETGVGPLQRPPSPSAAFLVAGPPPPPPAAGSPHPPSEPVSVVEADVRTVEMAPSTGAGSAWGQTKPTPRRPRIALVAVSAVALTLAAALLVLMLRRPGSTPVAAPAASPSTALPVPSTSNGSPPPPLALGASSPPPAREVSPLPMKAPSLASVAAPSTAAPPAAAPTVTSPSPATSQKTATPAAPKQPKHPSNPLDRSD